MRGRAADMASRFERGHLEAENGEQAAQNGTAAGRGGGGVRELGLLVVIGIHGWSAGDWCGGPLNDRLWYGFALGRK